MKHKGFVHDGKRIYFIDPRGKDASFDRWRVTLYYDKDYASTAFFRNETEYQDFLAKNMPLTYEDYKEFGADYQRERR